MRALRTPQHAPCARRRRSNALRRRVGPSCRHENTILLDKLSKILTREKTAQAGGATLPAVAAPPTAGGGLHDIYRRKVREQIDRENQASKTLTMPRRPIPPSPASSALRRLAPPRSASHRAPYAVWVLCGVPCVWRCACSRAPLPAHSRLQALLKRLQYMKPSIDMVRFEQQWQQHAHFATMNRSQVSNPMMAPIPARRRPYTVPSNMSARRGPRAAEAGGKVAGRQTPAHYLQPLHNGDSAREVAPAVDDASYTELAAREADALLEGALGTAAAPAD